MQVETIPTNPAELRSLFRTGELVRPTSGMRRAVSKLTWLYSPRTCLRLPPLLPTEPEALPPAGSGGSRVIGARGVRAGSRSADGRAFVPRVRVRTTYSGGLRCVGLLAG